MAINSKENVKNSEASLTDMFKDLASHPVPKHARSYMFCFGGITFLLFLIQIITGILLAIYYKPTPELAYESVIFIEQDVWMGAAIRSIHNIAANLMVITVLAHMLRVIYTGSYKPPRQLNWIIGACLLIVVFAFCFTGYLLPWDQLGYWAAVIGTKIMGSIPWLGEKLLLLSQAGSKVTGYTLTRFYALHIVVLPVIAIFSMVIHFLMIRKQGISGGL
ncbi:cytochrome b subunit of the bc complex [Desulfosporosinus meridiei DSM 13257]|uniref:Cytochrome b subunit of the bc complex n=2 Tax=Desulfosporosinus TaxID=79206 RepID=J7IYX2_DESMD|nr:cytochrome b subunit of the bc complex [Desulfosporosinus meridiei DSM 13257]